MKTSKIEIIMADGSQTPPAVSRAVESRIADMNTPTLNHTPSRDDLLAENKRLREALDNLIGCLRMVDGKPHICAASIQVASALEKARTALADK